MTFKYLDYVFFKRNGGPIRFLVHRKLLKKIDLFTMVLAMIKIEMIVNFTLLQGNKKYQNLLFFSFLKLKFRFKKYTIIGIQNAVLVLQTQK